MYLLVARKRICYICNRNHTNNNRRRIKHCEVSVTTRNAKEPRTNGMYSISDGLRSDCGQFFFPFELTAMRCRKILPDPLTTVYGSQNSRKFMTFCALSKSLCLFFIWQSQEFSFEALEDARTKHLQTLQRSRCGRLFIVLSKV